MEQIFLVYLHDFPHLNKKDDVLSVRTYLQQTFSLRFRVLKEFQPDKSAERNFASIHA